MGKVKDHGVGARIVGSVLLIIFILVLVGSIFKIVFGGSSFTFAGFLEYITGVPQITITDINIFHIGGDWTLFDGFRKFLNSIMSIVNFSVWFGAQLINGLSYIFYFVKFLLVV